MSETPQELPLADRINADLAALAGCVCAGLDPVCACAIMVGSELYDFQPDEDCEEECSRAWVRVAEAYPATGIGIQEEATNANCEGMINLQIEIGVVRCIEVPSDGEAPTVSALLAASVQQIRDMVAIRKAILCCEHFEDYMLGTYTPIGPEGPQIGGIWTMAVLV